ncbi:hypothetical protein [Niabella drilacis]|uniref:Uncharacterized protein n=1 Tax=Niabella drilacis (strain DSM 25811 / CCM 8410 / CCUG 62505 / LMG 26954 / E90) TaxID=1285928 RepID=A0A1G6SGJ6_NIADE|nr:hypothetical protein [Niabella drilacis]SDD15903.1 hypothetical protein SAMN04487894_106219 [Niabella drilacis]
MEELGLFLLIGGPIVGLLLILIGVIQLFGNKAAVPGRKTVLIGLIILALSGLIGFSMCSGM